MSPTHQDLYIDTTFSQIKSLVPVPLSCLPYLQEKERQHWRRILLLIVAITVHNIPEGAGIVLVVGLVMFVVAVQLLVSCFVVGSGYCCC